MFYRITIIGFVGTKSTMRYTPDGTPVTNFSVATRQVCPRSA
jgi:single-stranded DNA-binding protein